MGKFSSFNVALSFDTVLESFWVDTTHNYFDFQDAVHQCIQLFNGCICINITITSATGIFYPLYLETDNLI